MQTCEFVAKRILDSKISPDQHAEAFLKRVKKCFGEPLYSAFLNKYVDMVLCSRDSGQRKSGAFLRRLLLGEELAINEDNFKLSNHQIALFLISIIMPQFRNERFHGTTFPPFRSSVAKLKTYAHGYFILMIAYVLLLEVFLYRNFNVIESSEVTIAIEKNKSNFLRVFSSELKK